MRIVYLAWYFGFGCLAHWLWIGSHVDPYDMFTWVCLLLGPIMCIAWLIVHALLWILVLLAVSVLVVAGILAYEIYDRAQRRKRFIKNKGRMS